MVKLDNWQTKAERAHTRRVNSKQRKTRKELNRRNKDYANELCILLDSVMERHLTEHHHQDDDDDDYDYVESTKMIMTTKEEKGEKEEDASKEDVEHNGDGEDVSEMENNDTELGDDEQLDDDESQSIPSSSSSQDDESSSCGATTNNSATMTNVEPTSTNLTTRFQVTVRPPSSMALFGSKKNPRTIEDDLHVLNVDIWTDTPPTSSSSTQFDDGFDTDRDVESHFMVKGNDECDDRGGGGKRQRPRSQSDVTIGTPSSPKAKGKKGMKQQPKQQQKNKKISRPRSNSNASDGGSVGRRKTQQCKSTGVNASSTSTSSTSPSKVMCTAHFFHGSCSEIIRGASQQHQKHRRFNVATGCSKGWHVPYHMTLCSALSEDSSRPSIQQLESKTDVLERCKVSAETSFRTYSDAKLTLASSEGESIHTMGAVYHTSMQIRWKRYRPRNSISDVDKKNKNNNGNQKDESEVSYERLSETIFTTLKEMGINKSSAEYMVVNGRLIFDRHNGGVVVSDNAKSSITFHMAYSTSLVPAVQQNAYSTDEVVIPSDQCEEADPVDVLVNLPTGLLEHILLFLPENSISSVLRVCKDWNMRIGKSTPNLWRSLLSRRNWTEDETFDAQDDNEQFNRLPALSDSGVVSRTKKQFISHFVTTRTFDPLCRACESLSQKWKESQNLSTSLSRAKKSKLAVLPWPFKDHGVVVYLKRWSSRRIVVATHIGILRVYDVVKARDSESSHRFKCVVQQNLKSSLSQSAEKVSLEKGDSARDVFYCVLRRPTEGSLDFWFQAIPHDALLCSGVGGIGHIDRARLRSFSLNNALRGFFEEHPEEKVAWDPNNRFYFKEVGYVSEVKCATCCGGMVFLSINIWFSERDSEQGVEVLVEDDYLVEDGFDNISLIYLLIIDSKNGTIHWADGPTSPYEALEQDGGPKFDLYVPQHSSHCTRIGICYEASRRRSDTRTVLLSPSGQVTDESSWCHSNCFTIPGYKCMSLNSTQHGLVQVGNQDYTIHMVTLFSLDGTTKKAILDLELETDTAPYEISFAHVVRNDYLIIVFEENNWMFVVYLPTLSIIHRYPKPTEDFFMWLCSSFENGILFYQHEHFDGVGLIDSTLGDEECDEPASSGTTPVIDSNKKKKKSSARKGNSGKDGFARGMRMSV